MGHRRAIQRRWAPVAALLLVAAHPAAPSPAYALTRVSSALDDAAVVGRRRAGLVCAPNGSIRWGEVGGGTATEQREAVQDALEEAGVSLMPFGALEGAAARNAERLRAVVREARFDLCAKHWGLGDAKALSGSVALTVEWRIEDGASPPVIHTSSVSRTVPANQGAPLGALYRSALAQAARDAAAWLRADPQAGSPGGLP